MKTLSLCSNDWKLIYVKNSEYKKLGLTVSPAELKSLGYPEIPATVPGNLEIDLEKRE